MKRSSSGAVKLDMFGKIYRVSHNIRFIIGVIMVQKIVTLLVLLVVLISVSVLFALPAGSVQAQIIIFPTATSTRTPTPVNIGNFVWDDLDQDGFQDTGEPGLAGVTVQLWNTTKSQLISSDVTDANGIYTVIAPTPGDYRFRVVLPSANDLFSPKDANVDDLKDSDINSSGANLGFSDIFNIANNVISTTKFDAGIIKFRTPTPTRTPTPINIGNFVWDDLNTDGIQDAGEPGLPGVTVQLWNSTKTQLIHSDITDANGIYTVVAPNPGDYRLRVILPAAGDQFSPKDSGIDDLKDSDINSSGADEGFSDIFNIANNVISITKFDAGILKFRTPTPTRTPTPINLGNFVWHDLDADGIQDAGESGISGIMVQLWNADKTKLLDSSITNASGVYLLVAPVPGDYRVRVVPPKGSVFSPKNQGADDTKDSDITPNNLLLNLGYTDIFSIASNVISITSIDAGLSTVGAIPTATLTFTPTPKPANTPTPTPTPTQPLPGSWKLFVPSILRKN